MDLNTANIWIVGIGGIGSVVSYRLVSSGIRPLLIDGWPENVTAMNDAGLELSGQHAPPIAVRSVLFDQVGKDEPKPDIVCLCVKSFQTENALSAISAHLKEDSIVISLQNGINEEAIIGKIKRELVIGCVVVMDGRLIAPGVGYQENPNERIFVVGNLDGIFDKRVNVAAELLNIIGEVSVTDNIWGELWSKLVHNCLINGVCALTLFDGATALRNNTIWPFAYGLACEAVEVASANGIKLESSGLFGCDPTDFLEGNEKQIQDAIYTAYPIKEEIYPSMAQDIMKGRGTEINYLNGYIVRKGRSAGVFTPKNNLIVDLIHQVEQGTLSAKSENANLLIQG